MQTQTRPRPVTTLAWALAHAENDGDFRAQVLTDGRAAQSEFGLSNTEWHTLVTAVVCLEHTLACDPFAATEVDHGEADAAGAKGSEEHGNELTDAAADDDPRPAGWVVLQ